MNLPYLGRSFVKLIYVDVSKCNYIGSWTVNEKVASVKRRFLRFHLLFPSNMARYPHTAYVGP
jgi:hypothetical protein